MHDELSSATVLTLEYFGGVRLLEAHLDPERRAALARTVLDTAFRQLFEDGLFHADPHPGNFLLLPDGNIGLIDFGLVGRLSRQMREQLVILIVAVALKDSESVARLLYRIGAPDARANIAAFRSDIDGVLARNLPRTLGEVNARHLLGDLLDLAVKYRVRVPREYALLSRASVSMEGILRQLSPDLDILGRRAPLRQGAAQGALRPGRRPAGRAAPRAAPLPGAGGGPADAALADPPRPRDRALRGERALGRRWTR